MAAKSKVFGGQYLFGGLSEEENDLLLANSRKRHFDRGTFLYMQGDMITDFYIICSGAVQIFRETPDGHEVTSDLLISHDFLNVDEIFMNQATHNNNARAVDEVTLIQIPILWMKSNITKSDNLAEQLLASLSKRLQSSQIEAEHQSTMSAAQIVACYLQRLCTDNGFNPDKFELPYSKTLISSRLHIELETFSRTLKSLRGEGIEVNGTSVSFADIKKIRYFVCHHCSLSENCSAHGSRQ
jgi:CRP-like cAMP-binding protein